MAFSFVPSENRTRKLQLDYKAEDFDYEDQNRDYRGVDLDYEDGNIDYEKKFLTNIHFQWNSFQAKVSCLKS